MTKMKLWNMSGVKWWVQEMETWFSIPSESSFYSLTQKYVGST